MTLANQPLNSAVQPTNAPPSGRAVEDSIRHRLAIFLNTAAVFLAYVTVDPDSTSGWAIIITGLGSAFSHWRRRHANLAVKWFLAFGMMYALWHSLNDLLHGQFDPRLSLAQLLIELQVLNSFDLPRRRNLRVALLVAAILMIVSGTLSRTSTFGVWTLLFALTAIWALFEGYISETGAARPGWREVVAVMLGTVTAMAVFSLPIFVLAPRRARTLAGQTLPLSLGIPLPDALDSHVRNPGAHGGSGNSDAVPNGKVHRGFSGFSEHLDLDARMVPSDEIVLRVKADRPSYWRGMAFDAYDGRGWRMNKPDVVFELPGSTQPFRVPQIRGQLSGARVVQTFYVEKDNANLIFAAWAPREVFFPTATIWRDSYGGLRSPVTLQKDMYYSVVSEPPTYSRQQLAKQPARKLPRIMKPYMALPPLSDRVRRLSRRIVGTGKTPFQVMDALQSYLSGAYQYRLDVPAAPVGAEWVDHFLFVQHAGFCEQFATALAVMGRMNGIPTRLVSGYAPGDYNPFTGYYDVHSRDAHAWVEAWMPSKGWVPFDATPDATLEEAQPDVDERAHEVGTALWNLIAPHMVGRPWLLGPGLAILVLIGAGLRGLWRRLAPTPRRSTAIYRRLRRRLAKRGLPARLEQTPRDWLAGAGAVSAVVPALPELTTFVERYEALRFGATLEEEAAGTAQLQASARAVERALATSRKR